MYELNPALRSFWCSPMRYKALYGGRASSKSHDAAGMAVFLAANYKLKFLCARQFQNRISESVFTLIKAKIDESEYDGEFIITQNSIRHKTTGSEFLFYGIARNLAEIKSTEGVDILWLEEANYLTKEQWKVIEPTIRGDNSEIWLIWNPENETDFIYQTFVVNEKEDCISRLINWEENPFLSDTMLKVIQTAYEIDPEEAEHVYGGVPYTGSDLSVINMLFINAAIDAHIKLGWEPAGTRRIGYDVADDGRDTNAATYMYGNVIMEIDEWRGLEDELLKSATRVHTMARERDASVTFDCIGVGAFVGSKFKEIEETAGFNFKLTYDPFNAGGAVRRPDDVFMRFPHTTISNKDYFSNLKAQTWVEVATRFRKTYENVVKGANHPFDELISINSATIKPKMLKQLKIELSSPRKDKDKNGRFKVESKEDLEARDIASPNVADSVIMAAILPTRSPPGFFDM